MLDSFGPVTLLVLGVSFVAFASFSWGVLGHFQAPDNKMPSRMRLLSLANLGCFSSLAFSILSSPSSPPAGLGAVAGLILSIALFASAIAATKRSGLHVAFSGARSEALINSGPYRFIRHPFYASYMLFWMSGAVATTEILGWIASAIMVITYWRIAVEEEAQILSSKAGGEYAAYIQRSGRFVPRHWYVRVERS